MEQIQYVRIGQIINTHGNHGELKVMVITDFPAERFAVQKQVFVKIAHRYQSFTIQSTRIHQKFWLLKLLQIDNLDQAERLKGLDLYADATDQPRLAPDQYFYKDIMGITVQDITLGVLGKVVDIMNLGPNDVWTVRNQHNQEVLIPILKSTLLNVDLAKQVATVDLPEGLI